MWNKTHYLALLKIHYNAKVKWQVVKSWAGATRAGKNKAETIQVG